MDSTGTRERRRRSRSPRRSARSSSVRVPPRSERRQLGSGSAECTSPRAIFRMHVSFSSSRAAQTHESIRACYWCPSSCLNLFLSCKREGFMLELNDLKVAKATHACRVLHLVKPAHEVDQLLLLNGLEAADTSVQHVEKRGVRERHAVAH
uniref:Uncharacterized protein n=1 Tax=Hyaloperonospora arabidopsidis (strain Emoy2) TaxID=559515 RepID=M4B283_HYAAE